MALVDPNDRPPRFSSGLSDCWKLRAKGFQWVTTQRETKYLVALSIGVVTAVMGQGCGTAHEPYDPDLRERVEAYCGEEALGYLDDAEHFSAPNTTTHSQCRSDQPVGCSVTPRHLCWSAICAICLDGECVLAYPDDRCEIPPEYRDN